jgi:hypothetical protein
MSEESLLFSIALTDIIIFSIGVGGRWATGTGGFRYWNGEVGEVGENTEAGLNVVN